jgi:regulator of sigma E protease
MDLLGILTTIGYFIPVIFIVILVHELGHFLAAKSVGIRVERFSIGFPPKMVGRKFGETEYCLSWVPLGGYVKMAGMIDESLDSGKGLTGAPWEFMSKPTWAKIFVVSAGVIMNFILAFALYTGVTMARGVGETGAAIVGSLAPGYPAEEVGLEVGDVVTAIDGAPISTWLEMVDLIHRRPEEPTEIALRRGAEEFSVVVVPRRGQLPMDGELVEVGLIGIGPELVFKKVGVGRAVSEGWLSTKGAFNLVITSIRLLISGQASVKDLSGPVGIAKMSAESAKAGMSALLAFVAFISVNIGFLNILPIPALDGGHLIMVLWEGFARRPISNKVKLAIQQVGMVFILLLMVLIIFNDFTK